MYTISATLLYISTTLLYAILHSQSLTPASCVGKKATKTTRINTKFWKLIFLLKTSHNVSPVAWACFISAFLWIFSWFKSGNTFRDAMVESQRRPTLMWRRWVEKRQKIFQESFKVGGIDTERSYLYEGEDDVCRWKLSFWLESTISKKNRC